MQVCFMTLTLGGFLGRCSKSLFQTASFRPSKSLCMKKTCVIPILLYLLEIMNVAKSQ